MKGITTSFVSIKDIAIGDLSQSGALLGSFSDTWKVMRHMNS